MDRLKLFLVNESIYICLFIHGYSLLCAKGCGTLLLETVIQWASSHTPYEWLALSATPSAADWYRERVNYYH